jgi:electron transport complex protein RnfG
MSNKEIVKITLNLVVVYVLGGLILAVVYALTSPVIYRNALAAKEVSIRKIMPEADRMEKLEDWEIHGKHAEIHVAKRSNRILGYVVQSYGKGYSGFIDTLVAVSPDLHIIRIEILGHSETPGLGDVIETETFKKRFVGKDLEHVRLTKTGEPGLVDAVSGATISSRAVTEDAVRNGLARLTEILGKEAGNE